MERLRYLARGYFHQDYQLDAEEPLGVVRDFRDSEVAETVAELRRDLEELLSSGMDEEELATLWLDTFDAYYDPRQDGIEMTRWFRQMLNTLQ